MLNENIRTLRRQKGMTQETLAMHLHVVRQTVSKWEKGLSVPDAEQLSDLAELFEVPVSTLLGATVPEEEKPESGTAAGIEELAKQLAALNDTLSAQAVRRRRTVRRVILGAVLGILVLFLLYFAVMIVGLRSYRESKAVYSSTYITCELDGETYYYEVTYDQNYRISEAGGDAWIADHVLADRNFEDANVMLAQIEDYFTDRGGSCTLSEESPDDGVTVHMDE